MDVGFFWETLDSVLPRTHSELLKLPLYRSPPSSLIALRMGWWWDGAQKKAQMEDSPLVYYPTGRSLPSPSAICDDLRFRGIELDCREWQSAVKQPQPREWSRASNQEACYLLAIKEGKRDVDGKQPIDGLQSWVSEFKGSFEMI